MKNNSDFPMTKLSIDLFADDEGNKSIVKRVEFDQNVSFEYDKSMKGNSVSMVLTSPTKINAPNHRIYFKAKELRDILEFVLKSFD